MCHKVPISVITEVAISGGNVGLFVSTSAITVGVQQITRCG